jgi:hypothetical protein
MSKRLKLTMTACSLAGLTGGLLGLIAGAESVPADAGLAGPATVLAWFVGLGFGLALVTGVLGWLMREEFLGRAIRYLVAALLVTALVFGAWLWRRRTTQPGPQPPPPGVSIRTTSPA